METNRKTRTIAGRKLTLDAGRTYVAVSTLGAKTGDVVEVRDGGAFGFSVAKFRMTYAEATAFLAAFNDGASSLDGRVW